MTAVFDAPTTPSLATNALLDQLAERLAAEEPQPAVYLRGLDTHQAGAILQAKYPALLHRRRICADHDEHLVLDLASGEGVRVDLRWDAREQKVTATVAETDKGVLFARIVAHLTWWYTYGRAELRARAVESA